MNIQMPAPVRYAMNTLTHAGHQAYIVGGSVRDVLLGREPHDYDITTSALPEEMLELFARDKMLVNGLKHGTLTLIKWGTAIEMTTFRIDGEYSDGRHPDDIEFTGNLYEDVMRRDLTVNALCWNPETGLIDYVDGEEDLRNRIIRCVGDPDRRFAEDGLRILRALRFSATLDFEIDPMTAESAVYNRDNLSGIAAERVLTELKKLLVGARAESVLLEFRPVFERLLPELSDWTDDRYMLAARRVSLVPAAPELRLAALLYDMSSEEVSACAERLKFSKATRRFVERVMERRDAPLAADRPQTRRLIGELGEETAAGLIELRCAQMRAMCHLVLQQGDCVTADRLDVTQEELLRAGVSRRKLSACMAFLLNEVIEDRLINEKSALIEAAKADLTAKRADTPKPGKRRKKTPPV